MNLANRLTVLRLVLVPFFLIFLVAGNFWTRVFALITFIAAGITDLYDGAIARRTNTVTTLGTFLDPLADKLLISAALISFVDIAELGIPAWMVVLIISREFMITGLRSVAVSKGRILAATRAGKFKTSSQVAAIITILVILCINAFADLMWSIKPGVFARSQVSWVSTCGLLLEELPYWLMFLTTILTLISGVSYIWRNRDLLKNA